MPNSTRLSNWLLAFFLYTTGKKNKTINLKTTYDLRVDWVYNLINAPPEVRILCLAANNTEAFQDINDVVDPTPLHSQFIGALIQQQLALVLASIDAQKLSA